jgi:hypothetical protein
VPGPEARLVPAGLVRAGERAPDEVLDAVFARQLEDPDPPVDLGLLADGEAVQVYEGDVDALEGGVERGLVVAVAGDEGYVWERGEGEG